MGNIHGVVGFLCLAVGAALMVVMAVSWWRIFEKMGVSGWKSLVPVYGGYILYKTMWEAKIYFIALFLRMLTFPILMVALVSRHVEWFVRIASGFSLDLSAYVDVLAGSGNVIYIGAFLFFFTFVLQAVFCWRLAKSFDYSIGCFLGLLFLPIIFIPLLAFGDSRFDYY